MTRCQHCKKLTHSEDLYVKFDIKDMDKIYELHSLQHWTPSFQYYFHDNPLEIGKIKCGDIYIHFISEKKESKDEMA
jgi:hypothetical protein